MRVTTALLLLIAGFTTASAATIAIIGTGNVAGALGPEFAAQGHTIVYGSRDPSTSEVAELVARTGHDASASTQTEAVINADIVVLAVPGMLAEEITRSLGDLSDKIIIDPTNPMTRTEAGLVLAVETSNAEIIQAAAPNAQVVKAFNTLSWESMIDAENSAGPISIPLVGNSTEAKQTVAELVEGMGLEAIDLGGIENAHWVEGMLVLWINNRTMGDRPTFDYHLRKAD